MNQIPSYGKIYALGHKAIESLLVGDFIVEEKLDGSQISFALSDEGKLLVRSKGQPIHIEAPPGLFKPAVEHLVSVAHLLKPGWIYRGEAFQKRCHNTLCYSRVPTNHVALFDVHTHLHFYLGPDDKSLEAIKLGLESVPLLGTTPFLRNSRDLEALLETESFLGGVPIEGVVVKNYGRFTSDTGHPMMGKYVSEAFKEKHQRTWKINQDSGKDIKTIIGESLNHETRWLKAIQRMRDDGTLQDEPRDIGPLLKSISQDLEEEERQTIADALYEWARKDILRNATRGFPQWYKDRLAAQQFGETPTQE